MVKVSIIVPIYKVPLDFLKECLESLKAQTLQECEFIIVSDGSTNEENNLCKEYIVKDSRFKFFQKEHNGISATRNFGLQQAQGEYVTFVDADDWINPNTIFFTHQFAKEYDCDIVIFDYTNVAKQKNTYFLYNKSKPFLSKKEIHDIKKQTIHISNPCDIILASTWSKLINRKYLLSNNIIFDNELSIGEDRIFNFNIFSHTSRISYLHQSFYYYRVHPTSAMHSFKPDFFKTHFDYLKKLNQLVSNEFEDSIEQEFITIFYSSWAICYMNNENKDSFFHRMTEISNFTKTNDFQFFLKKTTILSLKFPLNIEIWMLRKHLTYFIWFHGIISSIKNIFYTKYKLTF